MELTVWIGLLASAIFISISPGPGAIFSISQGTQYGFKRALFSLVGLQLGLISQILFLLFGFAAVTCPVDARAPAAPKLLSRFLREILLRTFSILLGEHMIVFILSFI